MEPDRPLFPPVIDSTMISAWRTCPTKFFHQYVQHYKSANPSIHLVAGGAYASGIEHTRRRFYEAGASPAVAVSEGQALVQEQMHARGYEESALVAKTPERMAGALAHYFKVWPLETDEAHPLKLAGGSLAIEFSATQPLPITNPSTGLPILYVGRSDMIVEYAEGIFVEDDKTTSRLGPTWAAQWDLRSQFTGYCWLAQQSGIDVNGVLVRGVAIYKAGYGDAQAISYRSPEEVARWYKQLLRDIQRMIQSWEAGEWDMNLDKACTEDYGRPCQFMNVCKSAEPEKWLSVQFDRRVWNPLARVEQTVEEWEAQWIKPETEHGK